MLDDEEEALKVTAMIQITKYDVGRCEGLLSGIQTSCLTRQKRLDVDLDFMRVCFMHGFKWVVSFALVPCFV